MTTSKAYFYDTEDGPVEVEVIEVSPRGFATIKRVDGQLLANHWGNFKMFSPTRLVRADLILVESVAVS